MSTKTSFGYILVLSLLLTCQSVYAKSASQELLLATMAGDLPKMQALLDNGADINFLDSSSIMPLTIAVISGKIETVRFLVEKGVKINQISFSGTALTSAALTGNKDIVAYLVEHGANPNVSSSVGFTPLMAAAEKGHLEVVEYLLEKNADHTITAIFGDNALSLASKSGKTAVVKLLLDKGAKLPSGSAEAAIARNAMPGNTAAAKMLEKNLKKSSQKSSIKGDALVRAAEQGATDTVRLLLEQGVDINAVSDNRTALLAAVFRRQYKTALFLIDKGADINASHVKEGWTALMLASAAGRDSLPLFNRLLSSGANVNARDKNGDTVLMYAVRQSPERDKPQALVDKGADIHAVNPNGETAFHCLMVRHPGYHGESIAIAMMLIELGVDIDKPDKKGWRPTSVVAFLGMFEPFQKLVDRKAIMDANILFTSLDTMFRDPRIAELLISTGTPVCTENKNGTTPLMIANDPDMAKIILEKNCNDINKKDKQGNSVLLIMAGSNHSNSCDFEMVELLVKSGADINATNIKGENTLINASRGTVYSITPHACAKSAAYLLQHGASIHSRSTMGWTPLHYAVQYPDDFAQVRALVEKGADVNDTGGGKTPLMRAIMPEFVRYLVEHGARINEKDKEGRTALSYAPTRTVEVFISLGADVNVKDDHGMTPLMKVVGGDPLIIQEALALGADVNAKDKMGWSPLMHAVVAFSVDSVKILVGKGADIHARAINGQSPLTYLKSFPGNSQYHNEIAEMLKIMESVPAKPNQRKEKK